MRTRRMVAAAAAAMVLLSAGCAEEATRDAEGEIVEEGELDVFSFAVGDCFSTGVLGTDEEPAEIGGVTAVPCDEPHQNEVFHLFDLEGDELPAATDLQDEASAGCNAAFEPYVGEAYDTSPLAFGTMTPTAATWEDGDREVVCYLSDMEGNDLEGSMEGSGA